MTKKLKPVVFVQGKYAFNSQNTAQQIMLLKALKTTQDPKKLKELIGVRTVSEVYRTLDKIAMRKEYHVALAKLGIDFEYVAEGIKKEIDNKDNKASDRLAGLKMILQSIGLDKYNETAISGGGWEDILQQLSEGNKEKAEPTTVAEYEVVEPEIPDHVKESKKKSEEEAKGLYE